MKTEHGRLTVICWNFCNFLDGFQGRRSHFRNGDLKLPLIFVWAENWHLIQIVSGKKMIQNHRSCNDST